jgi:hypothetical protein
MAAKLSPKGTPAQVFKSKTAVTAAYMNGTKEIPLPKARRKGKAETMHRSDWRERKQFAKCQRENPARHVYLRHGRFGFGQIDLHDRYALPRRFAKIDGFARTAPAVHKELKGIGIR